MPKYLSNEEYVGLLIAAEKLNRLEEAGVDCWDGYGGETFGPDFGNGTDLEEFEEELKQRYPAENEDG